MDNDDHSVQPQDDTPPQGASSVGLQDDQTEEPRIVSKWRRLDKLIPRSQEYTLRLTFLLDNEMDRRETVALRGEDAAVVLNILARVRATPYPS